MECRVLFVDDMSARWASVQRRGLVAVWANTALQAIDLLKRFPWQVVYLDHDLETFVYDPQRREVTGVDVIRSIAESPFKPEHVIVHSGNPYGATRMAAELKDSGISYEIIPFPELLRRLDHGVTREVESALLQHEPITNPRVSQHVDVRHRR